MSGFFYILLGTLIPNRQQEDLIFKPTISVSINLIFFVLNPFPLKYLHSDKKN